MYTFDDLAQLQSTLERMAARTEPLVVQLARLPGSREQRWAHLLGGTIAQPVAQPAAPNGEPPPPTEIAALRESVARLEERVAALERRLGSEDSGS